MSGYEYGRALSRQQRRDRGQAVDAAADKAAREAAQRARNTRHAVKLPEPQWGGPAGLELASFELHAHKRQTKSSNRLKADQS